MRKVIFLSALLLTLLFPSDVSAHAFGNLYNLPVPFWMYLYGGGATLIVSFLIIGIFVNRNVRDKSPTRDLSKYYFFRFIIDKKAQKIAKIVSLLIFILTVVAGLFGENHPGNNFNMTFFWIWFTLGFTYFSAIFGNVWSVINPLILLSIEPRKPILKYPKWLGYYPALVLYFLFIWLELLGGTTPFTLSTLLLEYTLLNVVGVWLLGKEVWFKYIEFSSVFFRLIGKISPFEIVKNKVYLRPPFVGLIKESASDFSQLLFILFMLSSTAFDGFHSTVPFYNIIRTSSLSWETIGTVGLLISPFLFFGLYLLFMWVAKKITNTKLSLKELSLAFAFTHIPLAFVYNIAHYYTLLMTQGQDIIRLISDPFGYNWDLFGTANYKINLEILDAGVTWHTQVAFILAGHITGVYLSHLLAVKVFRNHKQAILSQIPMLILMVIYTVIGLWILSQPFSEAF